MKGAIRKLYCCICVLLTQQDFEEIYNTVSSIQPPLTGDLLKEEVRTGQLITISTYALNRAKIG